MMDHIDIGNTLQVVLNLRIRTDDIQFSIFKNTWKKAVLFDTEILDVRHRNTLALTIKEYRVSDINHSIVCNNNNSEVVIEHFHKESMD